MKRMWIAGFAAGALALAVMPAALAKPVTLTFHEHKLADTFRDVIPCLDGGAPATISTVENGVLHITAAGLDRHGNPLPPYHLTGTFTGTFTAVPDDSSLPTFTGHFTNWFGENSNRSGVVVDTDTFTVIAQGSDGSTLKFHDVAHLTVGPGGTIRVALDKPTCH